MELSTIKNKSLSRTRKTIGFVVDRINEVGGYQSTLWNGISEAAEEKDFNVIAFAGGQLKRAANGKQELIPNPIYNLISNKNVDGLVICSMTMGSAVGLQNIVSFCRQFPDLPVVSIGIIVEGIPSLLIDNEFGIRSAVFHLVEHHGLKKIAYIGGPLGNIDADQRLKSFISEMENYGINLDQRLIVEGDFLRSSGKKAINKLLNLKDAHFDALICASDDMAIGAMDELNRRNIHVPEDVAVIGFDDVSDAESTLPPLTTVKQPLYDIGMKAMDMIDAQFNGEIVVEQIIFPTELIVRQTCGCSFDAEMIMDRTNEASSAQDLYIDQKYLPQLTQAFDFLKIEAVDFSDQAVLLMKSFKETLGKPERIGKLLNTVFGVARITYARTKIEPNWNRVMAILSDYAIESADSKEALLSNIRICNAVWEMFGKISWLTNSAYRLKNERKTEPIRQISSSLVSTFNIKTIMQTMVSILQGLGVKQCWISVFGKTKKSTKYAKLLLGYDESRNIKTMTGDFTYPAYKLIPAQYMEDEKRSNLIVVPLKFKEKIFGFSIFGMDIRDLSIYELLTTQVSTAYQGAKVVEKLKKTQEKLREQANVDMLTQIYNRRYFMEFAKPNFNLAFRYKRQLSLALIDLDNFKYINDQFGHNMGDSILRKLAKILTDDVRSPDILARYGGDEFIIIMPETTQKEAMVCAERLRNLVEGHNFDIKDDDFQITVSIGVACLDHHADQKLENLIERADKALYHAKLNGKNIVIDCSTSTIV